MRLRIYTLCRLILLCYTSIVRICHTRKNTGMKRVLFALNVELHWWTSNLAPKQTESIADLVMMPNLRHAAMVVMTCSEQVSGND